MGKKALLRRVKHLEEELVKGGLAYKSQISDDSDDYTVVVLDHIQKFDLLHEKIKRIVEHLGMEFRWRANEKRTIELEKIVNKKKK